MKFIPVIFAVFLPTIVMADDLYTSDIVGGCGDVYYYTAVLEPISYNCSSGTYLPAGALSCQSCPNTHTCNGGTFSFDANHTQGLEYGDILVTDAIGSCSNEFTQNYSAIFEPITYVCNPGYYLPAGEDWINDFEGCRICPVDHYCVGGTYTYNETTDQGIEECPSMRPFAPVNSDICYAHKLHVGNEVLYLRSNKLTTPSLNVGYGNDVFYANMTTTPTYMTSGSSHYFKTIYNEQTYYICDDTTYGE